MNIFRKFNAFLREPFARSLQGYYSTSTLLEKRDAIFLKFHNYIGIPREAFLDSLITPSKNVENSDTLIRLHPDVWAQRPRLDILYENLRWQRLYKRVDYGNVKTRFELKQEGGRPWPQKGMGKARHATRRSPLWIQGGKSHGARSPRSYFFMLAYGLRLQGLIHTLSAKFAQDDVHIVDSLEILSPDGSLLSEELDSRSWSPSTLFVDVPVPGEDGVFLMPEAISRAVDDIPHFNLMPVHGLNVHSMLQHDTLVITLKALNLLEEKLLMALYRNDIVDVQKNQSKTLQTRTLGFYRDQ